RTALLFPYTTLFRSSVLNFYFCSCPTHNTRYDAWLISKFCQQNTNNMNKQEWYQAINRKYMNTLHKTIHTFYLLPGTIPVYSYRSEEPTSELQSRFD